MDAEKLKALQIDASQKSRSPGSFWTILLIVLAVLAVSVFFAWPRLTDRERIKANGVKPPTNSLPTSASGFPRAAEARTNSPATSPARSDAVLTVSGYIINR